MAVLNLWQFDGSIWTAPGTYGSSFFTNPWSSRQTPACDVWIQLSTGSCFVSDAPYYCGFGVIEVDFIGASGVEKTVFGDINNLANLSFPTLPVVMFQRQLLSFTVAWAAPSYYGMVIPTLIQWG